MANRQPRIHLFDHPCIAIKFYPTNETVLAKKKVGYVLTGLGIAPLTPPSSHKGVVAEGSLRHHGQVQGVL